MTLPPFVDPAFVEARLEQIFPAGFEGHNYCTQPAAVKSVFTMLYMGALDGAGRYAAPKHIYRMTDEQASRSAEGDRDWYAGNALKPGVRPPGTAWYEDTSREPVRDEAIRRGLRPVGAVVERLGLATTSPLPRYALAADFVDLFNPALADDALASAISDWRQRHLTPAQLLRVRFMEHTRAESNEVVVRFPDGNTRRMGAGESSVITKAVIENFAPNFLVRPSVLFLSESGRKVVAADAERAAQIRLHIDQTALLPDIVLLDLGDDAAGLLLIFVEVVHTDGPIDEQRREALLRLAATTHLPEDQIAFVTAYLSRGNRPSRAQLARLAWNSFVWFASEPDGLLSLTRQYEGKHSIRSLTKR